jgi:hypothetical protein
VRQIESRPRRLEQELGNKLPDVYVRDRYDWSVEAEIAGEFQRERRPEIDSLLLVGGIYRCPRCHPAIHPSRRRAQTDNRVCLSAYADMRDVDP